MHKATVVNEYKKSLYWGPAPYPVGSIPVAADDEQRAILLYYPNTGKFVLAQAGAVKTIDERTARSIMAAVAVK